MTIRTATVSVALIFTVCGCGSSSPTSPSTPTATSPTPPGSSATTVRPQAPAAAVEVSLVSVVPGTPSGDGNWCIGEERVTLTGHVVDTSQNEVTEGTIVWQTCHGPHGGLPKEACEGQGGARWNGVVLERSFCRLHAIHRHQSEGARPGFSLAVQSRGGQRLQKGNKRAVQSRYDLFAVTGESNSMASSATANAAHNPPKRLERN